MSTITLGDVEISRVTEWHGPFAPTATLFPTLSRDHWQANSSWLSPDHWDPATDMYLARTQSWVLRSEGRIILVDTGIGDDKERRVPAFHHLRTGFLDRLAAAGVRPEDVDLVVNTHAHADHVGWNTRLHHGEWIPTFPNAQYLLSTPENTFANPANNSPRHSPFGGAARDDAQIHLDSIAPLQHTGQLSTWDGPTHRIDANLTLELAPGHTPGSAVLRLASGTDRALFIGDIAHTPLQLIEPDHEPCLSEDEPAAIATRRRLLAEAADTNALIIPAHFGGSGAAEVTRDGSKFAITGWAAFSK
ncbi:MULTISPECIES: MBL fold metallo-hydrolase [unclassified Crossiella]|uniref:MBL fold metallo-hydrolase n=1 Tax=unclassified Crossiella TaxID=2620835 RepID=UPI001FFECA08|nr:MULTISPECIES: MBL fold metallo-hydrolase [unclassified Crossiella]MCK2238469.1 MBL fold metallo-hydrolase [Crossiella sp. S99.2]MCK2251961.1 MBL fold metallo-hydrolase [Crossiella sp. S99.1]